MLVTHYEEISMLEKSIDYAKFSRDWNRSEAVEAVAKIHGITNAEASRVAARLRKKGVQLKKYRAQVKMDIDVAAINKSLGSVK